MNGTITSFFLALILIVRLLPLSRTTNIIVNVVAGIVFVLFGFSDMSEKGWNAAIIAGIGMLFIIFSFIPRLTQGASYIWSTIILSAVILIIAGLEFRPKKKSEKSNVKEEK